MINSTKSQNNKSSKSLNNFTDTNDQKNLDLLTIFKL